MPYGTINVDNITTSTGQIIGASDSQSMKNRIINGNMYIAQRSNSATITAGSTIAAGYATVDRWYAYSTGANVTMAQVAGSGSTRNLLQITGAASVTAVGIGQRIESVNSYDLAGQTCTLSASISNSLLTTVTWTAYYANTTDTFGTLASPTRTQIATGTFTVDSTLTRYSAQITVPAAATTGIEIVFTVGAQTSGTWQLTNVQFEVGSTMTGFDYRQYGTELALCHRYFVNMNGGTNAYQPLGQATFYSTTTATYIITVPTQMRTIPTLSYTGTLYWAASTNPTITGFLGPYSQVGNILEGDVTVASGGVSSSTAFIRWNNVTPSSRYFYLSAEL